jgi:hypothetical protein
MKTQNYSTSIYSEIQVQPQYLPSASTSVAVKISQTEASFLAKSMKVSATTNFCIFCAQLLKEHIDEN